MPEPEFDLCLMDPAWPETGGGGRGTDKHFRTMPYDEIPAAVLGAPEWRPRRAFWCGIWTTTSSLPHALDLMRACGATYVTSWWWIKTDGQGELNLGMGQYGAQGSVEPIIWGKRGVIGRNLEVSGMEFKAAFSAPVGAHSAKPAIAYERAVRMFAHELTPLEMFARGPREGWRVHGNEVESDG